eukprot:m.248118 g.248118  ORF g.248118 m.248118 type:complete len:111 (-) comp17161_c5_seq2:190-522(-)
MTLDKKQLNISDEQHNEKLPANCFVIPRSFKDLFCYYVFILFTTSFLWLIGIYLWSDHKNDEELDIGRGLTIAGIVIGGGSLLLVTGLYLLNMGKPQNHKDETLEMQQRA